MSRPTRPIALLLAIATLVLPPSRLLAADQPQPATDPTAAPTAESSAQPPAQPDPTRIDSWLDAGRALKEAQPELFGGAEGVLATRVLPGGQGADLGIAPGDVLIGYGDVPLDSAIPPPLPIHTTGHP
jgi:hypothetical protein